MISTGDRCLQRRLFDLCYLGSLDQGGENSLDHYRQCPKDRIFEIVICEQVVSPRPFVEVV
jgi:hypothetical protein